MTHEKRLEKKSKIAFALFLVTALATLAGNVYVAPDTLVGRFGFAAAPLFFIGMEFCAVHLVPDAKKAHHGPLYAVVAVLGFGALAVSFAILHELGEAVGYDSWRAWVFPLFFDIPAAFFSVLSVLLSRRASEIREEEFSAELDAKEKAEREAEREQKEMMRKAEKERAEAEQRAYDQINNIPSAAEVDALALREKFGDVRPSEKKVRDFLGCGYSRAKAALEAYDELPAAPDGGSAAPETAPAAPDAAPVAPEPPR